MTTAQYRLPTSQLNFSSPSGLLQADSSGTFTVTAGSAQESALIAAGALLVVSGGIAEPGPTLKGANGATMISGDTLRVAAASTGTPGSGSAVQGVAGLDATGKVPSAQLPSGTTPPTIKESGGTALIAGDVLEGGASTSGTPGSGTAVVGFAELDSTGAIAQPIKGVATSSDAAAGFVGEYAETVVASGSAVSLTTATPAQVASLSLTAGDWDVFGFVGFVPAGTTNITALQASSSLTTAQIDSGSGFTSRAAAAGLVPGANNIEGPLPQVRYKLATTTNLFLNAEGTFTVAALSAYGTIRARRRR
jgi:hypothetical protein